MLDISRFPTRSAAGSCQVILALCDQATSCRSYAPFLSRKGQYCLMTALNCSSLVQDATTLIVVPCCMKPTNNTHLYSWKHDGPHCQQTSQPWMSPTHNASTPCLHVSTPVYGNNTPSPVTMCLRNSWPLIYCCWNDRAQAFLSTLWSSNYGNNSPVQTSCGIPIPKWSWQLFHVTDSSLVAVQSVILLSEDWIFHTFMSDVFTVVRLPFPSQLSVLICSISECEHHYATLGQLITLFP